MVFPHRRALRARLRPFRYIDGIVLKGLAHAQILIHQPFTQGIQGQASDIQIHAQEILRQREQVARIYAKHCKRQLEDVERAMERDFFMTPDQARDWGLIDLIVEKNPHVTAASTEAPGPAKAPAAKDKA